MIKKRLSKFSIFKEMIFNVFRKKFTYDNILICGEKHFIDRTIYALNLLKKGNLKAYKLVEDFIEGICLKNNFPYINIDLWTRVCFAGNEIAVGSAEAYASLLAQQAYYIYQHEEIRKKNPKLKNIPEELWCKGRSKVFALEFRKTVLQSLGVPDELIKKTDCEIEKLSRYGSP